MTKFTDKSTVRFPLAYFFSAMQAFDQRISAITSQMDRIVKQRTQLHQLYLDFDNAYQQSQKSMLTKNVGDLDEIRDNYGWVMEHVATLWAEKLDEDDLNIHGRRVRQVFKDYNFRTKEALVAENAKIENMEQRFSEATLAADLEAMGLTELNRRFAAMTAEIKQIMQQRNEENSAIATGLVKQTRDALEQAYRQAITLLNAVQELMPEDSISQAAQYYNEDFRKIEQQLAQARKGGSVSHGGAGSEGNGNENQNENGNGNQGSQSTPENPGTGGTPSGGTGDEG